MQGGDKLIPGEIFDTDGESKSTPVRDQVREQRQNRVYLIDVSDSGGGSGASTLQQVIEKEHYSNTSIYCFAGMQPPKISLALLAKYSEWLQHGKLHIVEPPGKQRKTGVGSSEGDGGSATHTLAFTAGQLTQWFKPELTKIFIASEDFALFNVVLCLRNVGFEVESSWPDPESILCNDDILFSVVSQIQRLATDPPRTLDGFRTFLRSQCKLPSYISLESVMRAMQEKGMISFHRGIAHYDPPVILNQTAATSLNSSTHRAQSNRSSSRRDTQIKK
jgi:hypothetical protein